MAIIINPFLRGSTGNGITRALYERLFDRANLGGGRLRIYPSTVPFVPSDNIGSLTYPSTHLLEYTLLNFSVSGSSIVLTSGTLAVNAVANGTAAWWAYYISNGIGITSDSIGLTGSGTICTLSSLAITTGQSVTVNFNLASL